MASFSWHMEEEKTIRELERWHKDMVKLQYLVNRGNWADDTVSKPFALYIAERMCEDLLQRIHERKSHLTIVDHNPVPVSDSDTEGIRANKRRLDEKRIDSFCLNQAQSPSAAPQREDRNGRMAASKRAIHKTDKNCQKKQKLEDRIGKIMNQIIVPREKANDDGLKWRKYGRKAIRNEIHKKDYYKCASKGCPGKKTVQEVDSDQGRIVYSEVHNCGTQNPLVMQQQQQQQEEIGSDQNAGVLVNEAQPEQLQSPIIPQEMCGDVMSYCQPNDGVLSSQIQVQREQQHDHSLPLSPRIAHSDEIGLELYNAGLVPHLPPPRPVYTTVPVHIESPSLDLSGLWSDEVLNEEGECSRIT